MLSVRAESLRGHCGGIAQLGERLVRNQEVRGSNPLISIFYRSALLRICFFIDLSYGGPALLLDCFTVGLLCCCCNDNSEFLHNVKYFYLCGKEYRFDFGQKNAKQL